MAGSDLGVTRPRGAGAAVEHGGVGEERARAFLPKSGGNHARDLGGEHGLERRLPDVDLDGDEILSLHERQRTGCIEQRFDGTGPGLALGIGNPAQV